MSDTAGLTQKQREDLLRNGWWYQDYLWFKRALGELGPEAVNKPNTDILFQAAKAEMLRLMRAMKVREVEDEPTVLRLVTAAGELYVGDLVPMKIESGPGWLRFSTDRCFVQAGTKRDGLQAHYVCGPMTRLSGWLEAMELGWTFDPPIGLCLPNNGRDCRFTIQVTLPRAA